MLVEIVQQQFVKEGGGGGTEHGEDVEGGREVSGGLPGTQSVSGLSGSLESSEL